MRHMIQAPPFLPPQGFPGLPFMPVVPSGPTMPSGQGVFPGQGAFPGQGVPGMNQPAIAMPGSLGMGLPQGMPTPPGGWPTMTAPPGGPWSSLSTLQGAAAGTAQSQAFQGWTMGREES